MCGDLDGRSLCVSWSLKFEAEQEDDSGGIMSGGGQAAYAFGVLNRCPANC